MTRSVFIGLAAAAAACGTVVLMADDHPPDAAKQDADVPFSTPLVAFTLMSDAEDLVLLKDVRERMIGDRKFLVGQGVDDGETADWRNNRRVWIAIEDVQQAVEFDSLESFKKAIELRRDGDTKAASLKVVRPAQPRIVKPAPKKS
jgi:hypothetical protein